MKNKNWVLFTVSLMGITSAHFCSAQSVTAEPGRKAKNYALPQGLDRKDWDRSELISLSEMEMGAAYMARSLEARMPKINLNEKAYLDDQKNIFKTKIMLNEEFAKKKADFDRLTKEVQDRKDQATDAATFRALTEKFDEVSEKYDFYLTEYREKFSGLQKQEWSNREALAKLGAVTDTGKREAEIFKTKSTKKAKLDPKDKTILELRKKLSACENPASAGSSASTKQSKHPNFHVVGTENGSEEFSDQTSPVGTQEGKRRNFHVVGTGNGSEEFGDQSAGSAH